MGLDNLADALFNNEFNGILVPDLPIEESDMLKKALKPYNIPLISLIAPTSKERIRLIAENAEGFIYIVSSLGVTGVRNSFHGQIFNLITEVKKTAKVPVILGFGISKRSQITPFEKDLDGFIIGSALIKAIQKTEEMLTDKLGLTDYDELFLQEIRSFVRGVLS